MIARAFVNGFSKTHLFLNLETTDVLSSTFFLDGIQFFVSWEWPMAPNRPINRLAFNNCTGLSELTEKNGLTWAECTRGFGRVRESSSHFRPGSGAVALACWGAVGCIGNGHVTSRESQSADATP